MRDMDCTVVTGKDLLRKWNDDSITASEHSGSVIKKRRFYLISWDGDKGTSSIHYNCACKIHGHFVSLAAAYHYMASFWECRFRELRNSVGR